MLSNIHIEYCKRKKENDSQSEFKTRHGFFLPEPEPAIFSLNTSVQP